MQEGYQRARHIIEESRDAMIRIAEALLEREAIDGDDLAKLIAGQTLPPLESTPKPPPPSEGTQEVLRPEKAGRLPKLVDGERPQHA